MSSIRVKPREGFKIRDPRNPRAGHIPPEGAVVEHDKTIRRHIDAGDLDVVDEPRSALVREAFPDTRKASGTKSEG